MYVYVSVCMYARVHTDASYALRFDMGVHIESRTYRARTHEAESAALRAASRLQAREALGIRMNKHGSSTRVEGGIEKGRTWRRSEDELWKNAAKNVPRLDLPARFPTACPSRRQRRTATSVIAALQRSPCNFERKRKRERDRENKRRKNDCSLDRNFGTSRYAESRRHLSPCEVRERKTDYSTEKRTAREDSCEDPEVWTRKIRDA